MCHYDLPVCPHPHQEHIVNLIHNPDRQAEWQPCERPSPWGKLSCGNLTVQHRCGGGSNKGVSTKCVWCTLALCTSLSKFKTTREEFSTKLKDVEEVLAGNVLLVKLDQEIATKEAELTELRMIAWEERNKMLNGLEPAK